MESESIGCALPRDICKALRQAFRRSGHAAAVCGSRVVILVWFAPTPPLSTCCSLRRRRACIDPILLHSIPFQVIVNFDMATEAGRAAALMAGKAGPPELETVKEAGAADLDAAAAAKKTTETKASGWFAPVSADSPVVVVMMYPGRDRRPPPTRLRNAASARIERKPLTISSRLSSLPEHALSPARSPARRESMLCCVVLCWCCAGACAGPCQLLVANAARPACCCQRRQRQR